MPDMENAIASKDHQLFTSMSAAVLGDGCIDNQEVEWLLKWFDERPERLNEWPYGVLGRRLKDAVADGVIDEEELKDLLDLLIELSGSDDYDAVYRHTETVPFNTDIPIQFAGKEFVFTGRAAFGARKACWSAVESRGGTVRKDITFTSTDYLVVGVGGSRDYGFGALGNKIAGALELQGHPERRKALYIITEEQWVAALNASAELPDAEVGGAEGVLWVVGDDPVTVTLVYNDVERLVDVQTLYRVASGGLYVDGFCRCRGADRTFNLGRVETLMPLGGHSLTVGDWVAQLCKS